MPPVTSQGARSTAYEFLRLYARTDYARPFVRIGRPGVDDLGTASLYRRRRQSRGRGQAPAGNCQECLRPVRTYDFPSGSRPYWNALPPNRTSRSPRTLDLTVHGVRYHIRNVFRKLEVSTRVEAVHRARDLGDTTEPALLTRRHHDCSPSPFDSSVLLAIIISSSLYLGSSPGFTEPYQSCS